MIKDRNQSHSFSKVLNFSLSAALLGVFLIAPLAQANPICTRGYPELKGSMDVVQSRGGIWGYLEKSAMKDKSMIGLQVDGKVQRLVVIFGNMCNDGKIPETALFNEIQALIGDMRMIYNTPPDRAKADTLGKIDAIIKKADGLLARLEA